MFNQLVQCRKIVCCSVVFLSFVSVLPVYAANVDSTGHVAASNVELFQQLVYRLTANLIQNQHPVEKEKSFALYVPKVTDQWIVETAATRALREHGYRILQDSIVQNDQTVQLTLAPTTMRVTYESLSRGGLFGDQVLRRTATVALAAQLRNSVTKEVFWSILVTDQTSDTVGAEQVPAIETYGMQSTHGIVPEDRFFDRIIEPLVIIGATGIAVFLFFQIRS